MLKQAFWDGDKSLVHNFDPQETVTKEGYQDEEVIEDTPMPEPEKLEDIEPEEIIVQAIEVDPSKLPPQARKKQVVSKEIPKDIVHVLPAMVKENYDPLYGEARSTLTFGAKFTMEAIIANQTDIQLALWTNSTSVGLGSIIYVPKDRRWWRVNDTFSKGGGNVMICAPSSLQPSFE